jgi:hypothetical protein
VKSIQVATYNGVGVQYIKYVSADSFHISGRNLWTASLLLAQRVMRRKRE